jgi:hypothetical protein
MSEATMIDLVQRALDRFGIEDQETKVHQRVNVRILELIDTPSGDTVQLEGNRWIVDRPIPSATNWWSAIRAC